MERAVKEAKFIIAIISDVYFERAFCLKELRWAIDAKKFIQPVVDTVDKGRIEELINKAPDDLRYLIKVDFVDLNQTDDEYFGIGVKKILRKATQQGVVLPHLTGVAHTLRVLVQNLATWRGKGGEGGVGIERGGGDVGNVQKSGAKGKEVAMDVVENLEASSGPPAPLDIAVVDVVESTVDLMENAEASSGPPAP